MALLLLTSMPVGFRFCPTDEELIDYYLKNKINGNEDKVSSITEVDLCKKEPWDLPVLSLVETKDDVWFFFCSIDRKYKRGHRLNRATGCGYWKATGKDRLIKAARGITVIGTKKTLVFYTGHAPVGQKTNWVIHEYRATSKELDGTKPGQSPFVLCKLMKQRNSENLDGMQDVNPEGSNFEEFGQNGVSPAAVDSFPVDRESERATPILNTQGEKLPFSGDNTPLQIFDRTPLVAPSPTELPNDRCIADDDKSTVEPDFELEAMLCEFIPETTTPNFELEDGSRGFFPETTMEPPDADGKIFLPSHSSSMPVGFRFCLTDEEIVNHFLKNKINGNEDEVSHVRVVDLCKMEPWDLPVLSLVETKDDVWFFFCPIDRKYKMGHRSNRATGCGYWKATGKDRLIKAARGTTVIGTKKTLVFYTGRAPVGQKTNWVIHEYHATSKELDGTKPGQGSFVLCKLMKKHNSENLDGTQDVNPEGSSFEEFEQDGASPAAVESFPVDRVSDPVTPVVSAQIEKLPFSGDNTPLQIFDRTPLVAPSPTERPNDSCIADDDKSTVEPDIELEAMLCGFIPETTMPDFELEDSLRGFFPETTMEPPDADGKIFLPSHSQVLVEHGSLDNDFRGVQLPDGTSDDVNQFLDSVIRMDDSFYDPESEIQTYINRIESTSVTWNVSCKELDAEVARAQNNENKAPVLVEMYSRGYKTSDISNEENLRNLGLGENESLGQRCVAVASTSDQSVNFFNGREADRENISSVGVGEDYGTGIRIRSRQSYNRPNAECFELQGNARRRIRLQHKLQLEPVHSGKWGHMGYNEGNQEANYMLTKVAEAKEKHSDIVDEPGEIPRNTSNYVTEIAQERGSKTISTSVFQKSGKKEVSPVPLEGPLPLHLISSSMHMLRVLMVVGLSIVCVGVWSFLKF